MIILLVDLRDITIFMIKVHLRLVKAVSFHIEMPMVGLTAVKKQYCLKQLTKMELRY